MPKSSIVRLIIFEQDGINHSVGLLRRLNRLLHAELAASVHTVRENDESFAALLFFHQFVRGEIGCVIEKGASARTLPLAPAAPARIISAAPARAALS